jgi:hypothetical protein
LKISFILSGVGEYRAGSRTWTVKAPCVITQWPGQHFEYGPRPVWEEFFIMYEKNVLPRLKRSGLADPNRLLVETALNVGEVAAAVGFRDPLYFSRRFHEVMGVTATGYRRKNRSSSIA